MKFFNLLIEVQKKCAEVGTPCNVSYYDETFWNMYTIEDVKTKTSIYSYSDDAEQELLRLIETGDK